MQAVSTRQRSPSSLLRGLIILLSALCLSAKALHADDALTLHETIKVSVRAIQASVPHESGDEKQPNQSAERAIHVDEELKDLQEKLIHLPFNTFRLLSQKEETLALKTRDSLQLPNGQSLMFRPIYMDQRKVGLWLNWKDRDGSQILNTRVHFNSQDTVLTGTDCSHNEGMILAIKAIEIPH
jgi:hypothetical protein